MKLNDKNLASFLLLFLPLMGSGQINEARVEEVVAYERYPKRKYEAIILEEYLKGTSSNIYQQRNQVWEKCSSLRSDDPRQDVMLSFRRSDCEMHHRESQHMINAMSLIIEWIMERNESMSETEAIHEVLYVDNKKRLTELTINGYLRRYQNALALQEAAFQRNTKSFIVELDNDHILLSDVFKTATLREIKEFVFTINDWVLASELKVLNEVMR